MSTSFGGDPAELLTAPYDVLEAIMRRRPAWHQHAACRGMGTDAFFPERGQSTSRAKAVCSGCPVTTQCALAARAGAEDGVWAGESTPERRKRPRATRSTDDAA